MADKKVQNQTEGKELAKVDEDELALALEASVKHQEKENEGDGVKADYILCANTEIGRASC